MKNISRFIVVTTILLLTTQNSMATYVYSTEKLNDGSVIKRCRFDNGKIDYCTEKDAMKALEVFHNPYKYMTEVQKQEKARVEALIAKKEKTEKEWKNNFYQQFPIIKKIDTTFAEYETQYNEFIRKQNLGLSYDEKQMEIIESKYTMLKDLQIGTSSSYTNPYVVGYSALTTTGIETAYKEIELKLNNKEISQAEFEELKQKLLNHASKLESTYNKIIATKGKVYCYGDSNNLLESNNLQEVGKNIIESKVGKSKVEKINNGLNSSVNMLNNAVNNARVIKGFFGN